MSDRKKNPAARVFFRLKQSPSLKAGKIRDWMSDKICSNNGISRKTGENVRHFAKLPDTALNNPNPHFSLVIASPTIKEQRIRRKKRASSSCTLNETNNTSTPT
ncbi:MAG: hypothetical protein IJA20_03470 [Methanocorpusculum sp.]|nr:hypothetical protein [Methanocorpusculum sp.]